VVVDTVMIGNTGTGDGHGGGGGGGMSVNGVHQLRNLLVVGNGGATAGRGGGLDLSGAVTVQTVTVYGNSPCGLYNATAAASVRDSILFGNIGLDIGGTLPSTLLNNCIGDGTSAGVNGNFSADPKFERPLFYIKSDSPCINTGSQSAVAAGLAGYTTQTNGVLDAGMVDLGYHAFQGLGVDLELYVNPDPAQGNDANDGSGWGSPLRTITRALARAGARTRIHLAAGAYTNGSEVFPLTIRDKTIQLMGTNAAVTFLDATNANQRVILVEYTVGDNRLEGLTLRNGKADSTSLAGHGGGAYLRSAIVSIDDCRILANRNTPVVNAAGTGGGCTRFRFVADCGSPR